MSEFSCGSHVCLCVRVVAALVTFAYCFGTCAACVRGHDEQRACLCADGGSP